MLIDGRLRGLPNVAIWSSNLILSSADLNKTLNIKLDFKLNSNATAEQWVFFTES